MTTLNNTNLFNIDVCPHCRIYTCKVRLTCDNYDKCNIRLWECEDGKFSTCCKCCYRDFCKKCDSIITKRNDSKCDKCIDCKDRCMMVTRGNHQLSKWIRSGSMIVDIERCFVLFAFLGVVIIYYILLYIARWLNI